MFSTTRTRWLYLILVAYLLLVGLFLANFARNLPYPILAAFGPVSFAVFLILFVAVRRKVWSSGRLEAAKHPDSETRVRRPSFLFGAILYSGIFIYGLILGYSQLGKVPTVSIVASELVNAIILIIILNSARKAHIQKR
jgi:hypothetical protein